MTRVIGLTGGIGSGKSTVSKFLAELGAVIIDADKIGHESYLPDTETWQKLVKTFGKEILANDNTIDRKKLGTIVFDNPEKLKQFNFIVHPPMFEIARKKIEESRKKQSKIIILDAPILFEANWTPLVDEVWVVVANEATVLRRAVARTGLPEEQIRARINAQMSNEERIKQANAIIRNDGTTEDMRKQVKKLWDNLNDNDCA
jgi:dephospho-CoA kinase